MAHSRGDRVLVDLGENKVEGIVMPNHDKGSFVIKLDSGYNIGFLKKEIKKIKVLEKYKELKTKKPSLKHSKAKETVAILHTGGTIASKVDYKTGAVFAKYSPEELVSMFPEIEKLVNVRSHLISNISSEDLRFHHYNIIAKEIQKEIKAGVDGIIITHGTDTLHYTAAALSFLLEDLPIPVILVGAQRSSDRGSSDAAMNLICAVELIKQTDFAEVGICMHKNMNDEMNVLLPGLKCRKLHSSRRDAFRAVNVEPYAEIDFRKRKVHILNGRFRKRSNNKLKLKLFKEDLKVGIIKVRPQMFAEEFKYYSKFDGLVIEGSGFGHIPLNVPDDKSKENNKIFTELKKVASKIPVVMTTQTIFGRVNLNVYSPGRDLLDIGVLGNHLDMHPETAYIKLAWLLSNYPKKVKEMYHENLRGELNERLGIEFL
jgi:glutamyl-tRNA(Gln) amidotransferase subunit D